jgi:hypothetical protein
LRCWHATEMAEDTWGALDDVLPPSGLPFSEPPPADVVLPRVDEAEDDEVAQLTAADGSATSTSPAASAATVSAAGNPVAGETSARSQGADRVDLSADGGVHLSPSQHMVEPDPELEPGPGAWPGRKLSPSGVTALPEPEPEPEPELADDQDSLTLEQREELQLSARHTLFDVEGGPPANPEPSPGKSKKASKASAGRLMEPNAWHFDDEAARRDAEASLSPKRSPKRAPSPRKTSTHKRAGPAAEPDSLESLAEALRGTSELTEAGVPRSSSAEAPPHLAHAAGASASEGAAAAAAERGDGRLLGSPEWAAGFPAGFSSQLEDPEGGGSRSANMMPVTTGGYDFRPNAGEVADSEEQVRWACLCVRSCVCCPPD